MIIQYHPIIAYNTGSTTSIILQINTNTIYTANVGDSKCFIFKYNKQTQTVLSIVYETMKHKADILEEKLRIEQYGGIIEYPMKKEEIRNGEKNGNFIKDYYS